MDMKRRIYKLNPDEPDACMVEVTIGGQKQTYKIVNSDFRAAVEAAGKLEEAP